MITDWSTKTLTVDGITYTMNNLQRVDTTLTANTPTKTPVLTDVNTVFTGTGNIRVEYRKAATAAASSTDIVAPSVDWEAPIEVSGGSNVAIESRNLISMNNIVRFNEVLPDIWTLIDRVGYVVPIKNGACVFHNSDLSPRDLANKIYIKSYDLDTKSFGNTINPFNGQQFYNTTNGYAFIYANASLIDNFKQNLADLKITRIYANLGTTPHPYIPYRPPVTIPLPEGFGGLPNAQDRLYLQDGKAWWEKNTAEVVLDGSEYWVGFVQANTYGLWTSKVSIKKGTGISNKLKNATIGNQLNTVRLNVDNRIYCYVSQNFTSESKWKAQLSQWNLEGVPLMVRYELASPETIDITNTPTGQAMLSARTYPHFTRVYSDAEENVKPTINATIKEVAL